VHQLAAVLETAFGPNAGDAHLSVLQMAARAILVYIIMVFIVRAGKKRFMARATAFDVILGIMLGSLASRAITGNAPFVETIVSTAVLVALHWMFSAVALHSHSFGVAIKGHAEVVIRDGRIEPAAMRKLHLTPNDLWEDLRTRGIERLEQVKEARLERSGKLSVIRA
jgi:uncharacterized membrane protein YcaP (DUF421 family)